jgi:RNA polymerase sigma-70 factor (ECF subfamily)
MKASGENGAAGPHGSGAGGEGRRRAPLPGRALQRTGESRSVSDENKSTDIRDGDDRDLAELIRALRRYARALVGDSADADDLVQEALKRALAYHDGTRQIDNLRAYLFTILHNVRIDFLKQKMRAGTSTPIEDTSIAANLASASDRLACNQTLEAIRTLNEEHRQVLLLVALEGMSYRETAEVLGVKIGTVMSRLSRARAALRDQLDMGEELEFDSPD